MILKIKKYPERVLLEKSGEIKEITPEIKVLADDMVKTMLQSGGIGLAAPQIGISKRLIVVFRTGDMAFEAGGELLPERLKQVPQIEVFINPRIIRKSKETVSKEEGCLSLPNIFLKVKRAKWVEVEALNIKGQKIVIKAQGVNAKIFQHEIDHLDGILIINKVGLIKKLKAEKVLKSLKKTNGSC